MVRKRKTGKKFQKHKQNVTYTVTSVTNTSADSPSRICLGGAKLIRETEANLPTMCGTLCCFGVRRSGVTTEKKRRILFQTLSTLKVRFDLVSPKCIEYQLLTFLNGIFRGNLTALLLFGLVIPFDNIAERVGCR